MFSACFPPIRAVAGLIIKNFERSNEVERPQINNITEISTPALDEPKNQVFHSQLKRGLSLAAHLKQQLPLAH